MTEKLISEHHSPVRRIGRQWKWIGLTLFASVIILGDWLPTFLVVLGWLLGLTILSVLTFRLLRYLKNRLFWRVRYRILGAFVFVGLIPLLMILGTALLVGYVLSGQLAARYLESSLAQYERELSWINGELATKITDPANTDLDTPAESLFQAESADFPKLAAHILRRRDDGGVEVAAAHDPREVTATLEEWSPGDWLGDRSFFQGIVERRDFSADRSSQTHFP